MPALISLKEGSSGLCYGGENEQEFKQIDIYESLQKKKVLLFLAKGFETMEFSVFVDVMGWARYDYGHRFVC